MRDKIKFKNLEEIPLEGIQVEKRGECDKMGHF